MSLGSMEQRTEGMKRQAQELIEQAYQRGFKAGQENVSDKFIKQGRDEAWEATRKIYLSVYNGGLPAEEVSRIFDVRCDSSILKNFSASEAVEKLRAYEEQKEQEKQKEDEEINVGDEVRIGEEGRNAFSAVVHLVGNRGDCIIYQCMSSNGLHYTCTSNDAIHKTGRTFPEIAEVLKKLKEGE